MKEGHEVFGEEDSNGYTAPISSRDEDLLDPSDGDFDRRKFSAASVDILIGKLTSSLRNKFIEFATI